MCYNIVITNIFVLFSFLPTPSVVFECFPIWVVEAIMGVFNDCFSLVSWFLEAASSVVHVLFAQIIATSPTVDIAVRMAGVIWIVHRWPCHFGLFVVGMLHLLQNSLIT